MSDSQKSPTPKVPPFTGTKHAGRKFAGRGQRGRATLPFMHKHHTELVQQEGRSPGTYSIVKPTGSPAAQASHPVMPKPAPSN